MVKLIGLVIMSSGAWYFLWEAYTADLSWGAGWGGLAIESISAISIRISSWVERFPLAISNTIHHHVKQAIMNWD